MKLVELPAASEAVDVMAAWTLVALLAEHHQGRSLRAA